MPYFKLIISPLSPLGFFQHCVISFQLLVIYVPRYWHQLYVSNPLLHNLSLLHFLNCPLSDLPFPSLSLFQLALGLPCPHLDPSLDLWCEHGLWTPSSPGDVGVWGTACSRGWSGGGSSPLPGWSRARCLTKTRSKGHGESLIGVLEATAAAEGSSAGCPPCAERVAWFYQAEFPSLYVHPAETLKARRQNWFSKAARRERGN